MTNNLEILGYENGEDNYIEVPYCCCEALVKFANDLTLAINNPNKLNEIITKLETKDQELLEDIKHLDELGYLSRQGVLFVQQKTLIPIRRKKEGNIQWN